MLLNSEHVLYIVVPHVCDCGAPKHFVNTVTTHTHTCPAPDQKTKPHCLDFAQCLFSPARKSMCSKDCKQAGAVCREKFDDLLEFLPYPPFSLPLNCFHLKETELVHSMKIWER